MPSLRPSFPIQARSPNRPPALSWLLLAALLIGAAAGRPLPAEENVVAVENRLAESVRFLASEELEGRGIGTKGLDLAAEYVADQFSQLSQWGLKSDLYNGSAFQEFTATLQAEQGPEERNRLALVAAPQDPSGEPRRIELELDKDFNPLAIGGSAEFDAPLVFAGYGITAPEHDYDDYQGIDVAGKVVLLLRKEPQQNDPHSPFNGAQASRHAWFSRKVSNAYQREAAAVILVNDHFDLRQRGESEQKAWDESVDNLVAARRAFQAKNDPTPDEFAAHRLEIGKLANRIQSIGNRLEDDFDQVLDFHGAGGESSHRKMPVFFCRRAVVDQAVKAALDVDLASLERKIDQGPTPQSQPLEGWRAVGEANVAHKQTEIKNVIAVLEGEGPLAEETIVVGAHYDHLGYGGPGSLAPWTRAIHHGADDNASGTAVLIEVARRLAQREQRPGRRIVFIAFTGEERGLLGSAHYVREPLAPLERTVAMINMDMVGRLRDNKLLVHGTGTAAEFDSLIEQLNQEHGFEIAKQPGGFGPSDHASFYAKQIPVLHFFTGGHQDYHRPSDTFDKINVPGMRRVADLVADVVIALADAESRPQYQETRRPRLARGGERPYFGSVPDFGRDVEGYALMGVTPEGPAERAGLKSGDVIIRFGDSKIGGLEDFDIALRKFKAGDQVQAEVKRGDETISVTVTLDPPR